MDKTTFCPLSAQNRAQKYSKRIDLDQFLPVLTDLNISKDQIVEGFRRVYGNPQEDAPLHFNKIKPTLVVGFII
ncbi:MAG: hypothetical protein IPQ08_09595 [Chitinophagaceae bacterium]|nr:hypothetical protein [Chitinophagaceae bacterium]